MDINLIRGAILISLILAFVAIWAWAWSKKRKPDFDRASRLPLEEDFGEIPPVEDGSEDHRSEAC